MVKLLKTNKYMEGEILMFFVPIFRCEKRSQNGFWTDAVQSDYLKVSKELKVNYLEIIPTPSRDSNSC